ncbi:helix-turn-helix domain-containing protein [Mycolicibacterium sp. PDY-3]|uniref:helix-turn-helix domain-containing protein n=1 Tax=Mycolicibacterium sp. PDY-3 TaxID=3376069 RepID=UPI003792E109
MSEFSKFRWHEVAMRLTNGITTRVAGVMFDRANMDGSEVYLNNEKLATELGCSEKSIRRARKNLETLGLATLVSRGHNMIHAGGRSEPSKFRLTMPTTQPDIDVRSTTGHLHNRTSVSTQPDTGVHLIDPGNKPGSSIAKGNIFDVPPEGTSVEPASFGQALPIADTETEAAGAAEGRCHLADDTSHWGHLRVSPSTRSGETMHDKSDPWGSSAAANL